MLPVVLAGWILGIYVRYLFVNSYKKYVYLTHQKNINKYLNNISFDLYSWIILKTSVSTFITSKVSFPGLLNYSAH